MAIQARYMRFQKQRLADIDAGPAAAATNAIKKLERLQILLAQSGAMIHWNDSKPTIHIDPHQRQTRAVAEQLRWRPS